MDNVFFDFLKKNWDEIVKFFDKLYAWVKDLANAE